MYLIKTLNAISHLRAKQSTRRIGPLVHPDIGAESRGAAAPWNHCPLLWTIFAPSSTLTSNY